MLTLMGSAENLGRHETVNAVPAQAPRPQYDYPGTLPLSVANEIIESHKDAIFEQCGVRGVALSLWADFGPTGLVSVEMFSPHADHSCAAQAIRSRVPTSGVNARHTFELTRPAPERQRRPNANRSQVTMQATPSSGNDSLGSETASPRRARRPDRIW
jgi:hypothetical protein